MRVARKRLGGAMSRHREGRGEGERGRHLANECVGPRVALCRVGDGGGQSTVEYLLVLAAFVSAIGALGLLWHAGRDGVLVNLATASASHGFGQGSVSLLKDVMEY